MGKMIAIDLDGTLLDDEKKYDKERFNALATKLSKHNVHIVIATGNQHVKAIEFFENLKSKLIFVTDNGATIHIGEELYYSKAVEQEDFKKFIGNLPDTLTNRIVISTHGYAMMSDESHPESFLKAAHMHYPVLKEVADLQSIDVPVVKLTLKFDEDDEVDEEQIEAILPKDWRMTSSGFGFYDIVSNGISKLTGIKQLQKLYSIDKEDIIAFGDSNNDFELLDYLPNSYAMKNSTDKIIQASTYRIGSNNDNAVIDTLEKLFQHI